MERRIFLMTLSGSLGAAVLSSCGGGGPVTDIPYGSVVEGPTAAPAPTINDSIFMLERSIKSMVQAYAYQPNTLLTWGAVNSIISSFLNTQWKAGALVGAQPADAYKVSVGLGSTMTVDDLLNGLMRVTVAVVLVRPGEFFVMTFEQQMQNPG